MLGMMSRLIRRPIRQPIKRGRRQRIGDGKPSPILFCVALLDLHIPMCDNVHMATNLALDDKLIEEARRLGEHKTKKEAVTTALEEYVRNRKQLRILEDFGTVDFDPAYDYRAERRRKRLG